MDAKQYAAKRGAGAWVKKIAEAHTQVASLRHDYVNKGQHGVWDNTVDDLLESARVILQQAEREAESVVARISGLEEE